MPRYYRRKSGTKYSNTTIAISRVNTTTNYPAGTISRAAVVPTTSIFGTRKVKNFKVSLSCLGFHAPCPTKPKLFGSVP